MSDQPRGRSRGRASTRGSGDAPPRRPGDQAGTAPVRGQQAPPGPRAQPPSVWAPPTAAIPAQRATAPAPTPGRGSRGSAVTHEHPGDVSLQRGMQSLDIAQPGSSRPVVSRGACRGGKMLDPKVVPKTKPVTIDSKKGSFGNPVDLRANYFEIEATPQWQLYRYHVDFTPEEDQTFLRRSMLKEHREYFGGGYIFDGTTLYTVNKLHPDPAEFYSLRRGDNVKIKLTVKLTGAVSAGDYAYLQIFNLLVRSVFRSLKLQLVGRDYFDPVAKVDIREKNIQVWPGYKTTINQYEDKLLMVVEITHKILRLDSIHFMLLQYSNTKGQGYKKCFHEDVVGKIVLTSYNNKTYRVDDVSWSDTPTSTFKMRDTETSYVDYYYKKYQVKIKDLGQPLLISRSKARDIRAGLPELVYLVPELCLQTGLSDEMLSDFRFMKSLSVYTKMGPAQRIKKLMDFNKKLHNTPEAVATLKEWQLGVSKNLVKVKGRILPPEMIFQGQQANVKYPAGTTNDGWTRDMRSKPLLSIAKVNSWSVITPSFLARDTETFLSLITKSGNGVNFNMGNPRIVSLNRDSTMDYLKACESVIAHDNPTFILIVLSKKAGDKYESIKKKCCVERPVPTQVVVGRNLKAKSAMAIATKIAIQINCKLGGAPWTVDIPVNDLMVIGYDVCHDTRCKEKSFGAMVATLDKSMTQYFSSVDAHTSGEELSSHMAFNIQLAISKFMERNNRLPSRIILYRDGVGDGQIEYVLNHEVEPIKKKLESIYESKDYKFCFIVVSKRINTRLFLERGDNPPPGTIVDDVITLPERYDFCLVSQNVMEGTVAPTNYNVISDNMGLPPDRLQRLTYKLTHMYFNTSVQIRVPSVCQYAHKLAFLTAQSLHTQPHQSLNTTLFFL